MSNQRWSERKAKQWYRGMPWLVGCNYAPRTAINQLEMWQAETFSPKCINEELKWAAGLGMNSVRVFLHNLVWEKEPKKFLSRMDQFLSIAAKHGIGAMVVFFDSVWHPFPTPGPQREPEPGVHNSGWVQSPGVDVLQDHAKFDLLKDYVTGVTKHFARDERVQVWDIWNEPDNGNGNSYGPRDLGLGKAEIAVNLLPRVFAWARAAKPMQPLTSGIWLGDWQTEETLRPIERLQLELSDVISFHNYGPPDDAERRVSQLERYGRPLLCTEYMSRGSGSTFQGVLPVFKQRGVAAYNWGLVQGRTQTHIPWDSWQRPYRIEPNPWFHEIFHPDGRPYQAEEVETIRSLTGKQAVSKRPRARGRRIRK